MPGNGNRAGPLPTGLFKDLLDGLHDAVYYVDRSRRVRYWNPAAERLTGIRSGDILGNPCCDDRLEHVDASGTHLCQGDCPLARTLKDGEPREADVWLRHGEGHRVAVATRISPVRDRDGRIVGAVELFRDNTQAMALSERATRMEEVALLDALTGLPNRRCVESALRSRMDEMQRYGWGLGVLFVDIDRFKAVNDRHGHLAGDRVLRMVSRTLAANTRHFDLLGRWGGEEFLAVLTNVDQDRLDAIAERSRSLVAEAGVSLPDGGLVHVTVSVGATLARATDTVESLLRRSDRRLYAAKSAGRDRVVTLPVDGEDEPLFGSPE